MVQCHGLFDWSTFFDFFWRFKNQGIRTVIWLDALKGFYNIIMYIWCITSSFNYYYVFVLIIQSWMFREVLFWAFHALSTHWTRSRDSVIAIMFCPFHDLALFARVLMVTVWKGLKSGCGALLCRCWRFGYVVRVHTWWSQKNMFECIKASPPAKRSSKQHNLRDESTQCGLIYQWVKWHKQVGIMYWWG